MVKDRNGIVIGCMYDISHAGWSGRVTALRYDDIDRTYVVRHKTREMRLDLHKLTNVKRARSKCLKTDTSHVYLYMCDIGGGCYKIGASSAPDRRRKQIRTYAQQARMRAVVRVRNGQAFRRYEKTVLDRYRSHRVVGGKEVLRLTAGQANDCVNYMHSICTRA